MNERLPKPCCDKFRKLKERGVLRMSITDEYPSVIAEYPGRNVSIACGITFKYCPYCGKEIEYTEPKLKS